MWLEASGCGSPLPIPSHRWLQGARPAGSMSQGWTERLASLSLPALLCSIQVTNAAVARCQSPTRWLHLLPGLCSLLLKCFGSSCCLLAAHCQLPVVIQLWPWWHAVPSAVTVTFGTELSAKRPSQQHSWQEGLWGAPVAPASVLTCSVIGCSGVGQCWELARTSLLQEAPLRAASPGGCCAAQGIPTSQESSYSAAPQSAQGALAALHLHPDSQVRRCPLLW